MKDHITLIGDSTIDNRIWVDRLYLHPFAIINFIAKRHIFDIKRDTTEKRIHKYQRALIKPPLSVIEHLEILLQQSHILHDYTNDGFTTSDLLHGNNRNKVFGHALEPLYGDEKFFPLKAAATDIQRSSHIILSAGGNDFREFLLPLIARRGFFGKSLRGASRKDYIQYELKKILDNFHKQYFNILEIIRQSNEKAQIILMTQYYPAVSQNAYQIYETFHEVGEVLQIDPPTFNPMTAIHEMMKMAYLPILQKISRPPVICADVTSSLNPYVSQNFIHQIEPSNRGGKKIAEMLAWLIKEKSTASGYVYRFLPEFFASSDRARYVQETIFDEWTPTHPDRFLQN